FIVESAISSGVSATSGFAMGVDNIAPPRLPYVAYVSGTALMLTYKNPAGVWTQETVATAASGPAIAVDDFNGLQWLSYKNTGTNQLMIREHTGPGTWSAPLALDALPATGEGFASIAFGVNHQPRIAYIGAGNVLRYAENNSGTWGTPVSVPTPVQI